MMQNGDIVESNVLQFQIYVNSDILSIEILRLTQSDHKNYVIALFSTMASIFCITGPDDLEVLLNGYKGQN